jgi:hypothetical protein
VSAEASRPLADAELPVVDGPVQADDLRSVRSPCVDPAGRAKGEPGRASRTGLPVRARAAPPRETPGRATRYPASSVGDI